jgi:hypothetical protein
VEDELDRASADPAAFVDDAFQQRQRPLVRLPNERATTGER